MDEAVIEAALHNLMLDLNGGDESALDIMHTYTGRSDLTFGQAQGLVCSAERSLAPSSAATEA